MHQKQVSAAQRLTAEGYISEKQLEDINDYHAKQIFSLHDELQMLLYLAVLMISSGAGMLVYQNIDSIGHMAILGAILLVCAACYAICFKKCQGFSRDETNFAHPAYNYLVLAATLLACTFIGYLQFQYQPFGNNFGTSALLSAIVAVATAYYFDNRNALAIGLASLAAAIGITATPKAVFENNFFDDPALFYYGIALGFLLISWAEYSAHAGLKKHFVPVILIFSQHLTAICALTGMLTGFLPVYALLLFLSCWYCWRQSYITHSTALFVFVMLYGYIGINIVLFKGLEFFHANYLFEFITMVSPLYIIGSIFLFIRAIKHFNRKANEGTR